eukprot:TRINITY_DN105_c0_g3_i1.p1 TRINITY_DN105_c0_g3~~TRINITY_DN105_c0_g3_i1.p1  ORF type:complete len:1202 (-),score=269.68 TRINITY_DN105_c0_g3_i1:61-3666(-)
MMMGPDDSDDEAVNEHVVMRIENEDAINEHKRNPGRASFGAPTVETMTMRTAKRISTPFGSPHNSVRGPMPRLSEIPKLPSSRVMHTGAPLLSEAIAHGMQSTFSGANPMLNVFCSISEMSGLGVGVILYLQFVFYSTVFMAIYGLLSIPALWTYYSQGSGGSIDPVYILSVAQVSNQDPHWLIVALEFAIGIAFFAFYTSQWINKSAIAEEVKMNELSVSDYSIFVKGLPYSASPKDIAEFFSQWGQVVNVVCVSDTLTKLRDAIQSQKLIRERIRHHKAYSSSSRGFCSSLWGLISLHKCYGAKYWEKRLEANKRFIKRVRESHIESETKYTGHAFVTFSLEEEALACLKVYNRGMFMSAWDYLCCATFCSPPLFSHHSIIVTRPPEPDDVIYPNFNYSSWTRFFRRNAVTPILSLVLIAITFIGVSVAKIIEVSKFSDSEASSTQDVLQNSESLLVNALVSLGIIILGEIITFVLQRFADFERHISQSGREAVALIRLFAFRFINTAAVVLVVALYTDYLPLSWNIFGSPIKAHPFTTQILVKNYGDTILFVMGSITILPNLQTLLIGTKLRLKRKLFAFTAHTQVELNKLYEGENFRLAERYSYVLTIIFYCALWSTVFPIVPFFGFTALLLTYWIDKYNLLYHYKKPPKFDARLAKKGVSRILKYSYILHAIAALVFLWFNSPNPIEVATFYEFKYLWSYKSKIAFVPILVMVAFGVLWFIASVVPIFSVILKFCRKEDKTQRAREQPYNATMMGAYIVAHDLIPRMLMENGANAEDAEELLANHVWNENQKEEEEVEVQIEQVYQPSPSIEYLYTEYDPYQEKKKKRKSKRKNKIEEEDENYERDREKSKHRQSNQQRQSVAALEMVQNMYQKKNISLTESLPPVYEESANPINDKDIELSIFVGTSPPLPPNQPRNSLTYSNPPSYQTQNDPPSYHNTNSNNNNNNKDRDGHYKHKSKRSSENYSQDRARPPAPSEASIKQSQSEENIKEKAHRRSEKIKGSRTTENIGERPSIHVDSKTKESEITEDRESVHKEKKKQSRSKEENEIRESQSIDNIKESSSEGKRASRRVETIKESVKEDAREIEVSESVKGSKSMDNIKESASKEEIKGSKSVESIKESTSVDNINEASVSQFPKYETGNPPLASDTMERSPVFTPSLPEINYDNEEETLGALKKVEDELSEFLERELGIKL